jgi:hypothetical protein
MAETTQDQERPIIMVVEAEPQRQEYLGCQPLVEEAEQVQQLQFQKHQHLIVVVVAPVAVHLPQRQVVQLVLADRVPQAAYNLVSHQRLLLQPHPIQVAAVVVLLIIPVEPVVRVS